MMRFIVAWSLSFRLVVLPVAAALLVVGVVQLRETPVDVLPEFAPTYIQIQTEALGLSASEVEELITVPLERDLLNGVAGVDVIRSESVLGLSSITLVFEPGTDLLDARQLVQERLIQAHILPNVAKPPTMLQPLSVQSRVMMVGLYSDALSPTELGLLARWTIRPRLLGVSGVANVVIWGQREHQLHVQVDPVRLREHGVTLEQVISTTGNAQLVSPLSFLEASTPGTGGFIDTPNQRLQVRHILPIAQASGLAEVAVDGADGRRLRLGDVAEVVEDHQPLIGDAIVEGRPGLILVVEKFPGANTLDVTRDVEDALAALRPGLSGVEIDAAVFRPATSIETALDNLGLAVLVGGVLLALVLLALFLDWRPVVISLVSVPLSLVAAGLVLALRGETMNALAFAGLVLAVGVVVDDTTLAVANVRRRIRREQRESRASVGSLVLDATLEVRSPLAYATLIALLAVVPVFFVEGGVGDFFAPLAVSWVLAVLASTIVALTVTPALSVALLRRGGLGRDEHPLTHRIAPTYRTALSRVVDRPVPALVVAGGIGLAALALTPFLGQAVVPAFEERELLIRFDGPPGTSQPEMVRIASRSVRELEAIPGVRNAAGHVGRAVMGDEVVGANAGSLWVTVDAGADYDQTLDRIRAVVDGYPGLERELQTYSAERIRTIGAVEHGGVGTRPADGFAALRGVEEPLVVRIYGKELPRLRAKAAEVRELLHTVDGVVDPRVEEQVDEPTLEIEPSLQAASRHGIKPGDIHRAAATLVHGLEVGSLFEEQKVFEVVVRGVPEIRHSPTGIRALLIDVPSGGHVRLEEVADVRVTANPTVIRREATSRRIDVAADVRGRDLRDVLDDVETRLAQVEFPLEYHAEVLSASTDQSAADGRFVSFAVAAAVAIFLLIQAALGSWRLAAAFLALLPFALLGGIVGAVVDGRTLSLGALAGLLFVFALAVRHGLLLVHRYQHLQREGVAHGTSLVVKGAEEAVWPVVVTAVAAVAALLPFLVRGDIAGYEIAHPLAAVVLGGVVTSTLFVLFVVPALYTLFGSPDPRAVQPELTQEEA